MHTGYHILLLLVITVLIVVLDQYVRSREDNQETFEGFTNTDCSRTLLSGGSVNNSHKTALVCDGGYCKNSGGGNGCCIDIGAVAPVPTCTTINKHYIVRADDGSIINESKKACEYESSYSLNPLSGEPLCEYDEATKRCQPTKYYPKKPKQPDCGNNPLNPSKNHGKKCRYGPTGNTSSDYCNLRDQYEKCVSMVKQGIAVSRGTNGPIKCTDPSDEDCIHSIKECKKPFDETPSGFGCYGSDFSAPFQAPLKNLGPRNTVCQYNPQ